jgi:hypothetical protein
MLAADLVHGKDLAPFGEGPVGCDDRAVVLVTATYRFEQQIGMAIGIGERPRRSPEKGVGIVTQAPAQAGIATLNPP